MILADSGIIRNRDLGIIKIEPWEDKNLGPNSYDLHLANELLVYSKTGLYRDVKKDCEMMKIPIPESGYVISPGILYLGKTLEYTETHEPFVPMIEGVSSVARHGIFVHVTAGFGDVGFCGNWTLEISAIENIRIYPGMRICQIYYHQLSEKPNKVYNGKYQKSTHVGASKMFKEFN